MAGAVTLHPDGSIYTVDGTHNINVFRMRTLLSGLRMEVKAPGLRLTRGPKCSTRIRREFGLKGSPAKLLEQFEAYVAEHAKYENVTFAK